VLFVCYEIISLAVVLSSHELKEYFSASVVIKLGYVHTGRGSALTVDGEIEMDASIMDGLTLNAGGVACIRNVANPIKVARLVMEKVLF